VKPIAAAATAAIVCTLLSTHWGITLLAAGVVACWMVAREGWPT
jgi:hypothetical protein